MTSLKTPSMASLEAIGGRLILLAGVLIVTVAEGEAKTCPSGQYLRVRKQTCVSRQAFSSFLHGKDDEEPVRAKPRAREVSRTPEKPPQPVARPVVATRVRPVDTNSVPVRAERSPDERQNISADARTPTPTRTEAPRLGVSARPPQSSASSASPFGDLKVH